MLSYINDDQNSGIEKSQSSCGSKLPSFILEWKGIEYPATGTHGEKVSL